MYDELFALTFSSFLLHADPALFPGDGSHPAPPDQHQERVGRICNADAEEHLEAVARAHDMNLAALVTHLCTCWRRAGFVGEPAWLDERANARPLYHVGPHDFVVLSTGTGTHAEPRVAVFPSCDELVRPVIQRQGSVFIRWSIPHAPKIAATRQLEYLAGPSPLAHDNSSKHTSTTRAGTSFVSGSFATDEHGQNVPRALDSTSPALRQLLHPVHCSLLPPTWITSDRLVWRFHGVHASPGESTEPAIRTSAPSLDEHGIPVRTASPAPHVVWRLEVPRRDSGGTLVLDGEGRRTLEVWDIVFSTKYAWAAEQARAYMALHHPELAPTSRALSLDKGRFVARARGSERMRAFA